MKSLRLALMLLLPGLVAASSGWADCCSGYIPPAPAPYHGSLPSVPTYPGSVPSMPAPLTCQSIGLVGWWKFDETSGTTAADSSGSGNTGELVNGPAWVGGRSQGAISIDSTGGNASGVQVPYNSSFDFGANQDFTVSVWVKSTQQLTSNVWPAIVDHDPSDTPRTGYEMYLHEAWTSDPRWFFQIYSAGSNYVVFGSHDIADGNWHHLVGMRHGSNFLTYEDGIFANQASGTTASISTNGALGIGTNPHVNGASWSAFEGSIDDVRIYSRALTAAEVQALYNSTGP